MKRIKPVLWTVLGVVIGVSAVLTASRVQAQDVMPAPKSDNRIVVTPVGGPNLHLAFVKDTKSGGCWIGGGYTDRAGFASLAVAPPSACVP